MILQKFLITFYLPSCRGNLMHFEYFAWIMAYDTEHCPVLNGADRPIHHSLFCIDCNQPCQQGQSKLVFSEGKIVGYDHLKPEPDGCNDAEPFCYSAIRLVFRIRSVYEYCLGYTLGDRIHHFNPQGKTLKILIK